MKCENLFFRQVIPDNFQLVGIMMEVIITHDDKLNNTES